MLKNLLIVEDNPSMRRLIKSVVKDLAIAFTNAKTGWKLWRLTKHFCPNGF